MNLYKKNIVKVMVKAVESLKRRQRRREIRKRRKRNIKVAKVKISLQEIARLIK